MSSANRQVNLAARPKGFPKETDFELAEGPAPEFGERATARGLIG